MANTITGGSLVTPITGDKTLAELVTRWRLKLDDNTEPYLWSNQEFTDYMNNAINQLCREIPLIEDYSTAAICNVTVLNGSTTLSISDRIIYIKRAKLLSQERPLTMVSLEHMDYKYSDWEDATSDEPSLLIVDGMGTNKVRLYPPSNAADTLKLTVIRLPQYDMTYASDSAASPEIPGKYFDKLDNGVIYQAYLKQDADTMDQKKSDYHLKLWMKDFEDIKRSMLRSTSRNRVVAPHGAFS